MPPPGGTAAVDGGRGRGGDTGSHPDPPSRRWGMGGRTSNDNRGARRWVRGGGHWGPALSRRCPSERPGEGRAGQVACKERGGGYSAEGDWRGGRIAGTEREETVRKAVRPSVGATDGGDGRPVPGAAE